jgi:hypothetical protein
MYRITSDYGRPFEEKIQDLLQLGREHLDVETAFFTELTSDTQVIVADKETKTTISKQAHHARWKKVIAEEPSTKTAQ